jgi:CRISPR-associated endonuclease/helicase Cas3
MSTDAAVPRYAAHSPNASGHWQSMRDHVLAVAELARKHAAPFGGDDLAYWSGLLHDLGKYTPEFQQYLWDCHRAAQDPRLKPPRPGSAPHKQHGAAWTAARAPSMLPFIILGHHGFIPCAGDTKAELAKLPAEALAALFQAASADCPELAVLPDLARVVRRLATGPMEAEFLARMVYSCLVDADSLDTERHFNPDTAAMRERPLPTVADLTEALRESQRERMARAPDTPLNRLRREVYEACQAASSLTPGVFRLTVPTGCGKTLSSLAFALEHARAHGLERVIYGIPYTSIVDQTAQVFEGVFGSEAVLEHHSALEPDEGNPERELWRRLAAQNWDAPLIVTTTVQLFESLWGNRPARSRKVHRLARAVIVLDEVQSLPPKLVRPLVDGLRLLAERYGSTILLCTATQPALDRNALEHAGFAEVREIVTDPPRLFAELKRVTYDLHPLAGEPWGWPRVAERMRAQPQSLTILNTRKDALALLDALGGSPEVLHLSTLLCGRHRRDVLTEIRRRLKSGEPCRLVSTQVVECGVDVDFPLVLRALGPLDRIVQAAGRCNREGARSREDSRVVIFRPEGGGMPRGSYEVAFRAAEALLNQQVDLDDPATYERYFRRVFAADHTDARGIQQLRAEFDFPAVAERLRLIDDDTVGVLVPYAGAKDEIRVQIDAVLNSRHGMTRDLWRRVQPFLVSLARREFDRFQKRGLVVEIAPDLWQWLGGYDPVRGITEAGRDLTDLIV